MAFDLTAPFTGSAYTGATGDIKNYLSNITTSGTGTVGSGLTGSLADLTSARDIAAPAVAAGFNTGRQDVLGGISGGLSSLYGGQTSGVNALTGAQDPAIAALQGGAGTGIDAWRQLLSTTGASNPQTAQQLADSLGLNGPEGTARAQAAFQGAPGFQFGLGTGLDALARNANTGGMVAGGNLLRESQKFGQDYGNQQWQQYVDNLNRQLGLQAQVGTSAAGGVSDAAQRAGAAEAAVRTGTAGQLAQLYGTTGTNAANLQLGGAKTLADLASQAGLSVGSLYTDTAAREAAARAAASGQSLDLLKSTIAPYTTSSLAGAQAETQGPLNLFNLAGNAATFGAGGGFNPASYTQLFGQKTPTGTQVAPSYG